jgi:hypothetical protein
VRCEQFRQCHDRIASDTHPRRVVLPRVGLDQHREAVALREIAGRKARRIHAEEETGRRVIGCREIRVEGQGHGPLRREPSNQTITQVAPRLVQPRVALVDRLGLQRDVGLEVGSVGDVQVGAYQRIPAADQAKQRAHLRRVRLGVIPVEIEILRGGPPAGLGGAVLVGPVPARKAFVPIDVEGRHEENSDALECARSRDSGEQFPKRDEAGILAIALARMDTPL